MKSIPLKIKLLNLAAEIRIIKSEEKRIEQHIRNCPSTEEGEKWKHAHYSDLNSIRQHRYDFVKTEARDTMLAYGYLRGRSYARMEPKRYSDPNWNNIERMILKYGKGVKAQDAKQGFEQWKQEAGAIAEKVVSGE